LILIQSDISKRTIVCSPSLYYWKKKAYGVSAGDGEVHFTVRSDSNSQMKKSRTTLENWCIDSKRTPIRMQHCWTEGFQTKIIKRQQIKSETAAKN
jgi:hypothetical protein